MIRNRLAALIAERGLKITRVAKDTGISRNTITSIAQNDSEMMRMETINTLCKYLGITPCEFYEYEPLDIDFFIEVNSCQYTIKDQQSDAFDIENHINITNADIDVIMEVNKNPHNKSFDLSCKLIDSVELSLDNNEDLFGSGIPLVIEFDNDNEKNMFVDEVYTKISAAFYQDIYKSLESKLTQQLQTYLINDFQADSLDNVLYIQHIENKLRNLSINLHSDVFKKF